MDKNKVLISMEELSVLKDLITGEFALYVLLCNACTYAIVELFRDFKKPLKKGWKRIVSTVVALLIGTIMIYGFHHKIEPIFCGFFIQFLTWDYLFKPIILKIVNKVKKDDK